MKKYLSLFLFAFSFFTTNAQVDSLAIELANYEKFRDSVESKLVYQYGKIDLKNGLASITVPKGYKFLNAEQSNYVLTELWGNPPSDGLGMLLPENISPLSDNFTYAVEISYSEDGYIEDGDADDIDYDELLESLQKDASDSNQERTKQGYETIKLIGWASTPFYDKKSKKLHWAQEFQFGDADINTLNYNIRVLGRKGYINMNAIGEMDILPMFKKDITPILASVEFNDGNKYGDFNPDLDQVAAYGIGGLVAGKLLAKVGILAGLLKFWKIIAIAIAGGFAAFKNKIFGKKEEEV
jgi:uncharacterized membrane-anchored protein